VEVIFRGFQVDGKLTATTALELPGTSFVNRVAKTHLAYFLVDCNNKCSDG